MSDNLLSTRDVSIYLFIPLRTVQRLSKEGKIKAVRIGNKWKYSREDIERYRNFGTDFSREPARRPEDYIERRAYPRINANFRCQYSVNLPPFKNINKEGVIKNMSAGGVFLVPISQDDIEIDDPIDLEFTPPLLAMKKDCPAEGAGFMGINASGRIIRKGSNGFGIKFRDISNEDKERIIQYVG